MNEGNVIEMPTQLQPAPQSFTSIDLTEEEVLTLYSALQRYHQALAQADDLAQSARVIALMSRVRPSAVEASKLFQAKGGQQ